MEKRDYLIFWKIAKKLEMIAEESNKPTSEIIDIFISDLQSYDQEGYEKKMNIDLENLTPHIKRSLITYLNNTKKRYKVKEASEVNRKKKADEESQMQEKWRQIEKSIDGNIMDPEVMEKVTADIEKRDLSEEEKDFMKAQLDEKSKKFNETWKSIEAIVERESTENSGKTKPEYWQSIRELIVNRDKKLGIKMNEEMEKQMISMIDERIASEKDNIYYEQVRCFTYDFTFLRDDPLVVRAISGAGRKKFTDRESYDRYCNLRSILQKGHSREYSKIERLLSEGKVDNGDRRILEQRMKVMAKEASIPEAR